MRRVAAVYVANAALIAVNHVYLIWRHGFGWRSLPLMLFPMWLYIAKLLAMGSRDARRTAYWTSSGASLVASVGLVLLVARQWSSPRPEIGRAHV